MLDKPFLFLFPGMGGYDPELIKVGVACEQTVRPVMISYPPWRTQLRNPAFDFDALITNVVAQITGHSAPGPILLAGYSFGGNVAFAAAARLQAAGYVVRFFGLLDADFQPGVDPATGMPYPAMTRLRQLAGFIAAIRNGNAQDKLAFVLARELGKPWWNPALRLFARFPQNWLRGKFVTFIDRDLLSGRIQAMMPQWISLGETLPPLLAPAFLFRTNHHHANAPRHLGWERCCPTLTVISVPGTHNDMLAPSNLPAVCAIFTTMVLRALEPTYAGISQPSRGAAMVH